MKPLEELCLNDNDLRDAGFDALKSLPRLQYLSLHGSYITAAAIPKLCELKQLEWLFVGSGVISYEQNWTDEQIRMLQEALPDTTIVVDFEIVER